MFLQEKREEKEENFKSDFLEAVKKHQTGNRTEDLPEKKGERIYSEDEMTDEEEEEEEEEGIDGVSLTEEEVEEEGKGGKEGEEKKEINTEKENADRRHDGLEDAGMLMTRKEEAMVKREERKEKRKEKKIDIENTSFFELAQQFVSKKELTPVNHQKMYYLPIVKALYKQVDEITRMTDEEVSAFKKTNGDIQVKGQRVPRPMSSFAQAGLKSSVLKLLEKKGILKPFPIQMQAIPAIMAGRDVMGIAQTGSGKTLAFLLPLLRHILAQISEHPMKNGDGPIGLIIAPTRELALQIHRQSLPFFGVCRIKSVCAYGGGPLAEQFHDLKVGCEAVVATPGRLIDVLVASNGKITNLRRVSMVILDEADRMFDMGFEPQITMVLKNIQPRRQMCMFSATFPVHVQGLAKQQLKKPVMITIGEAGSVAQSVSQHVVVAPDEDSKFFHLLKLLGEWATHGSVIVFMRKQEECDGMYKKLTDMGWTGLSLVHGGMDQADRDHAMDDFKFNQKIYPNILLTTSICARGLDVNHVLLVVNFGAPEHLEDYIHRVGRTGRAGKKGFAYTLLTPLDAQHAPDLLDVLKSGGHEVTADLIEMAQNFQAAVSQGLAKKASKWGGYAGQGYSFKSTEKSQQQRARLQEKKRAGIGNQDAEEYQNDADVFKGEDERKATGAVQAAAIEAAKIATRVAQGMPLDNQRGGGASKPPPPPPPGPPPKGKRPPPPSGPPPKNGKAPPAPKGPPPKPKAKAKAKITPKTTPLVAPKPPPSKPSSLPPSAPGPGAIVVHPSSKSASSSSRPHHGDALMLHGKTSKGRVESAVPGLRAISLQEQQALAIQVSDSRSRLPPGWHLKMLEINDYPQLARSVMAKRENRQDIESRTQAKVQIKGIYIEPGKKVPDGAIKLYVEIMAPSTSSVDRAYRECFRLVEDTAKRTLNIPQGKMKSMAGYKSRR